MHLQLQCKQYPSIPKLIAHVNTYCATQLLSYCAETTGTNKTSTERPLKCFTFLGTFSWATPIQRSFIAICFPTQNYIAVCGWGLHKGKVIWRQYSLIQRISFEFVVLYKPKLWGNCGWTLQVCLTQKLCPPCKYCMYWISFTNSGHSVLHIEDCGLGAQLKWLNNASTKYFHASFFTPQYL